jgi:hypothetical protein
VLLPVKESTGSTRFYRRNALTLILVAGMPYDVRDKGMATIRITLKYVVKVIIIRILDAYTAQLIWNVRLLCYVSVIYKPDHRKGLLYTAQMLVFRFAEIHFENRRVAALQVKRMARLPFMEIWFL